MTILSSYYSHSSDLTAREENRFVSHFPSAIQKEDQTPEPPEERRRKKGKRKKESRCLCSYLQPHFSLDFSLSFSDKRISLSPLFLFLRTGADAFPTCRGFLLLLLLENVRPADSPQCTYTYTPS